MDDDEFRKSVQQMLESQQAMIVKLTEVVLNNATNGDKKNLNSTDLVVESLSNSITEFSYDPEAGVIFDTWFARYEDLFSVDAQQLDDAAKVRLLLRKINTIAHDKYINFILPKHPRDFTFEETIEKLKKMFGRQTTLFNARYQCLSVTKKSYDDFVTYAGIVNKHCENFKLSTLTADQFKSLIFVCGLQSSHDSDIRTTLLSKIEHATTAMTLEELSTECQRLINLKCDTAMIENPSTSKSTVNAVNVSSSDYKSSLSSSLSSDKKQPSSPCWGCGDMHYLKDCSFSKHQCNLCKQVGHKEGYCNCFRSSSNKSNKANFKFRKSSDVKNVNQVNSVDNNRKYMSVLMNNIPVTLQIDSASDITIVSEETWNLLGKPSTKKTEHVANDASGKVLNLLSEFQCNITFNNVAKNGTCFVTSVKNLNLLGIDFIEKFGFWNVPINSICNAIRINQIQSDEHEKVLKDKFPDVFSDSLGLCTKAQVKFYTKPETQPIFRHKRPVAYAAIPAIDQELQRLEQLGIITKVDYSDWAAPIVVVKKGNTGKIRICADYSTGLNNVLEPNQHPLPLVDDIFAKLANCKIFSKIDLSDAYLQVEVEPDSRKLLTINTHRGLFQFNRLVPGVKSGPGAFQQIIDAMIADLKGVDSYLDDIIIAGETEEIHSENLMKLLQRIQQYGFRLKIDKCQFFMHQIKYLGFIVDGEGIRPDPAKIEVITNMHPPKDISTLRSLLGAINFYGKFVKNMHNIRQPLDKLLKKDTEWCWSDDCQKSFDKFKEILQSDLLLTHYNPELEVIVAGDASNAGVGACILHKFPDNSVKAICHAARTLTPAEENYSQIEKEALALIFAVTKFHRMIFGRKFKLQTDHKPLISIFGSKKGIPVYTANRLQRWALTLLLYDFDIEYISTENFGHADILSRLINSHMKPDENYVIASIHLENDINQVLEDSLKFCPITFQDIKKENELDNTFIAIKEFINGRWPNSQKDIKDEGVKSFFARKESLSLVQDCIMFMNRVVIPQKFRRSILNSIHNGHPGMERMKSIARSYVYWPGIDEEINDFVRKCNSCSSVAKSPTKTLLSSWDQPERAWQRLHIDYAGPIDDYFFLLIVDAYSKWPEIFATKTTTAAATIKFIEETFSRFGNPEVIVSDNGTQFVSNQFQNFCKSLGINHIKTAPYHPQSNGQAERFVDTFKRGLEKIKYGGYNTNLNQNIQTFLSAYRSTPNKTINSMSPSEMLIGRKMRTTMDLLLPSTSGSHSSNTRADKQNEQFNIRHGAKQRSFKKDDLVYAKIFIKNKSFWASGIVIEEIGNVMYNVWIEDDKRTGLIRSHTNQLKMRYEDSQKFTSSNLPLQTLLEVFEMDDVTPEPAAIIPESLDVLNMEVINEEMIKPARIRKRRLPARFEPYVLY